VDWYPWGPEALSRAAEENKPIFLSIGHSACHWCHVMERESFENEGTAALMNVLFVNIKVDREERHDPFRVVTCLRPGTTSAVVQWTNARTGVQIPTAYVCQNHSCRLPVTTPEALSAELDGSPA
jgi:uncharacterized protein YyaL (SSP411 family)